MVAHMMSTANDFLKNLRMLVYILAHAEESRLHAVMVQDVKHLRRDIRVWSIVKGDVNGLLLALDTPQSALVIELQ